MSDGALAPNARPTTTLTGAVGDLQLVVGGASQVECTRVGHIVEHLELIRHQLDARQRGRRRPQQCGAHLRVVVVGGGVVRSSRPPPFTEDGGGGGGGIVAGAGAWLTMKLDGGGAERRLHVGGVVVVVV